ncbi:hypothetical protein GCM10028791_07290 [Echinicola sediminis]
MKSSWTLFIPLIGSLLVACDPSPQENSNNSINETTEAADKPLETGTSTWYTYEGTVPCADCSGIKMTLYLENHPDKTSRGFRLKETFLGTPEGDRTFETSGRYEVIYGTNENPGAMLISLIDENGSIFKNFLQEKDGNSFTLLDQNKKKIDSTLNYKLTKK